MNSLQPKRKTKKSSLKRNKQIDDNPSGFSIKLFVAVGILLIVLLMKKYDLSVGQFNVDSIYEVVYHNEDLSAIKDKILFFQKDASKTSSDSEVTTTEPSTK